MDIKKITKINKGRILNLHNNAIFKDRQLLELVINNKSVYLDIKSGFNLDNCDYLKYYQHDKEKRNVLYKTK